MKTPKVRKLVKHLKTWIPDVEKSCFYTEHCQHRLYGKCGMSVGEMLNCGCYQPKPEVEKSFKIGSKIWLTRLENGKLEVSGYAFDGFTIEKGQTKEFILTEREKK